ncbi:MAG: NADH-quinone oxidoreductase subunit N [Gemmatimonadetes bacterium]|nr:NADH-quinone oxidoreductase subunit N [Gemmatimonadota bacterium]
MALDFASNVDYLWALLPEILLCITAMAVLIAGVWNDDDSAEAREGARSWDLGWIALAGVAASAVANGWLHGVHEIGTSSMIAVDGFRLFANWIFLVAAALSILISFAYVYRQRLQAGEYYGLLLLSVAGMMFMAGARDLIVVFLGLEVMSIAVYALSAFNRRDRRSAEAGLKYFLLGAFSTGFFLYGIALVYGTTGTTHLPDIATAIALREPSILLLVGIALIGVGFAFKVSAVPFHMWTPDVYEGAPTPITAFMSAGVKAAAFAAFFRVFLVSFMGAYQIWFGVIWWLAAISMVAANLIALVQTNVKRMLAYSSVAHGGYLLVGLAAANQTAAGAALFYLLVYAVMNVGAFAVVIAVSNQGEERLELEDYAGLGRTQPALALFLTLFLLSLAGFPGTGGFMAKFQLLLGAMDARLWVLSVILVLSTVVSYAYYLRLAWYAWMREPAEGAAPAPILYVPLSMRLAMGLAAAIILWLGLFPGPALDFARQSVAGLMTVTGGVAEVP